MTAINRYLALACLLASPILHAGPADSLALDALSDRAGTFELSTADIADIRVRDSYSSRHNGVRHVWMQQYVDGLPVALGLANANLDRDGKVLSLHSRMSTSVQERTASRQPALTALDALKRYAEERRLDFSVPPQPVARHSDESLVFSGGSMADAEIPAQLAWLEHDNRLHLVWDLAVDERGRPDWLNAFIDAHSGDVLLAVNWTQDAAYRVFPEPLEHPGEGPDQVVTDPDDAEASPLGWHDDGTSSYTDTRGNNVLAQEDTSASNSGGRRPDGGVDLDFDFGIDLATQQPPEYENFAITNLFYWNNRIHDVLWHFGFDEPAGNFQTNNFDRGGAGNDAVRADAQDGSGTNNANFSSPPDGIPGRMQMYIWQGAPPSTLRIDAPAPNAGDYAVTSAGFGSPLDATGVDGALELVDDGSGNPDQGCSALQGFTSGNIALIYRGNCQFGTKALNAEQAGAVAAIVINNEGGNGTISMGPGNVGDQVTIPVAMIGNNDGDGIVSGLDGPVTGRLFNDAGPGLDRDSDLDAGVIAHEYGHGLSIRLTGGPSSSSCLFGSQQAGEGWSDFLGLWLTAKVGDRAGDTRGVGSYLLFQENVPGAGIRPAPYSRDMTANPLVYESIGSVSVPHGVGTVFATALWDMYWNLVDEHGFDPDFINGSGGNHIAMQLVIDGLKMQPCGPTFLDTRDAMLQADVINNDGANQCAIWDAFARRGMGENASDGGSSTSLSVVNGFQLPQACRESVFVDGFESPD